MVDPPAQNEGDAGETETDGGVQPLKLALTINTILNPPFSIKSKAPPLTLAEIEFEVKTLFEYTIAILPVALNASTPIKYVPALSVNGAPVTGSVNTAEGVSLAVRLYVLVEPTRVVGNPPEVL